MEHNTPIETDVTVQTARNGIEMLRNDGGQIASLRDKKGWCVEYG